MEAVNEVPKTESTEQINNAVSTPTNEVVNTPVNNATTPVNNIQNNMPVNNTVPQTSNITETVNNQVPNVVSTIPVTQVVQPNIAQSNVSAMPQQSVAQPMYNQTVQPAQVVQPVAQQSQPIQQMPQTTQVEQPVVPQPINAVSLNQMVNGQTTYPNKGYAMPQAQAIPQPMPNQQVVQTPATPMPNVAPAPAATPVNTAPIAGLNFVTGKTPETEKDEEEVWKL